MKVFVLTHYLDNGEEYPEDRMEWEEHYYFSSEEFHLDFSGTKVNMSLFK